MVTLDNVGSNALTLIFLFIFFILIYSKMAKKSIRDIFEQIKGFFEED